MSVPNTRSEIGDAAEDILARVKELNSPRDAVVAIMTAHIKLSLDDDMNADRVEVMLTAYCAAFKEAYFQ